MSANNKKKQQLNKADTKPKRIVFLEKVLRFMAKSLLHRHQPQIIGISGSVGKSSAKEAIWLALKDKFKVRKSAGNYNNEIGIPLTIIGAKSGEKNFLKWLIVALKWLIEMISPFGYPKILILEMAIDHPGDMKYLTEFIQPDIGILTDISFSHLKFFKNVENLAKEKIILLKQVKPDGLIIYNADNKLVKENVEKINKEKASFGLENSLATFNASDIRLIASEDNLQGLSFKLNYKGKIIPFRLPNIIARHQIYAVLTAVVVADYLKINLIDVAKSLEEFKSPPGRMNLLSGLNESLIIDDTYNSSPTSTDGALQTLKKIDAKRKIVILGDMLELGDNSIEMHRNVVKNILQMGIGVIILVGNRMSEAVKGILEEEGNEFVGYRKRLFLFDDPVSAGEALRKKVGKGDLILVKGSQAMRMEKVVEKIMANPDQSQKLLCRQSEKWRKRKFKLP
ncbi:MAG TPA: UDP-N-acetylmuramoyl-tripeptide--D-alanyl-D-alanine ligase [Candidatus Moranbacteria bacterium]|nr:UDP-N-acetylmuramoyl-tripeptide--D-alanyl-D-alanine ligase [Candidatus Moranbacteria bacterium]